MKKKPILYLVLPILWIILTSEGPKFSHLTIKDGLSQSSVKCLFQDSKGFLWIGTADGLNKFDGYKFEIFNSSPVDPFALSGNDIKCVHENTINNALWVGTQNAGLNLYNREHDNFYSFILNEPNNNNSPVYINDILSIGQTTWFASGQKGICYFNSVDSTFTYPSFCNMNKFKRINCFENDKNGNLWLGTSSGLYLWRYANKLNNTTPFKIELPSITNNEIITSIKLDIKGNLWVGTQNNGLYKYHPKSNNIEHYKSGKNKSNLPNTRINDVLERKNGEIWIATQNGLCKFLSESNNFEIFINDLSNPESLNNNTVYSILEDQSGIIWIGTYLGGLNLLDPMQSRFPKYNDFSKLEGGTFTTNDIRSITVDNSKTVWIGTSGGLLEFKRNGSEEIVISETNCNIYLEQTQIGAIVSTNNGIIFSSPKGIQLKNNSGKYISLSALIQQQTNKVISRFSSGIVDEFGQVWFSTNNGLLKYIPASNIFELYNPIDSKGEEIAFRPMDLREDQTGKIWIGTFTGNLFSFDKYSNNFELVLSPDKNDDLKRFSKIFSLCTVIPKEIWIGTNLGLYRYVPDTRKIERFLSSDGLANNVVYSAIADKNRNIWCSTNLGISMLNTKSNEFQNYTFEDGLQSNEFNQGASFRDNDGEIYFGGIEGLNIFHPENIVTNDFIPNVIITQMEIQHKKVSFLSHPDVTNKHISETSELSLKHNQNAFSFEFTALSFSLTSRNNYKYTLTKSGHEDNWVDAGTERKATYTNISPGEYTFKVMGSNSDGFFNEIPTILSILVKPPYWQTWPFRIIVILFILGTIYLIIYSRIRSISRQKIILKKLVRKKTNKLLAQTSTIETQNEELKEINKNIVNKNLKIEQKNKLLEDQHLQLSKQHDKLLQLAEKVEITNQTKLQFFTSVSHELRTPLTLVLGPIKDIVKNVEANNKSEAKRKLKNVYSNASKLLLIVNQLLDFRKVETDNFELRISNFDLIPFLQKCAFMFNEMASQRQINFKFVSDKIGLNIWADQDILEKTIFNLLSNAFKVTPKGGAITLRVFVEVEEEIEYTFISLKDNGAGIDEEEINHIFDRFYQTDDTAKLDQAGSGLGLALVKKYIELHKGSITAASSPGSGSEFRIKLQPGRTHFGDKVQFANQKPNNQEILVSSIGDYLSIDSENAETENSNGKRSVLLVENDKNMREYLKEILSVKYPVLEAESSTVGFQIAESKIPDIIISDIRLSDTDGFQLCEKLKTQFKTSHIPVILLTSLADKENHMKGIKAGADAYISKPFDLEHLMLTIENLVEGRQKLHKRYSLNYSDSKVENKLNARDRIFIQKAISFIEENLKDTSFNVEQLCAKLNISQPQCYRKIKAITGYNISEFIRNTRLKEASKLLKEGNCKVSEAAYQSGFNDPNYFTKSFTKLYGMTPSEYGKSF